MRSDRPAGARVGHPANLHAEVRLEQLRGGIRIPNRSAWR